MTLKAEVESTLLYGVLHLDMLYIADLRRDAGVAKPISELPGCTEDLGTSDIIGDL